MKKASTIPPGIKGINFFAYLTEYTVSRRPLTKQFSILFSLFFTHMSRVASSLIKAFIFTPVFEKCTGNIIDYLAIIAKRSYMVIVPINNKHLANLINELEV